MEFTDNEGAIKKTSNDEEKADVLSAFFSSIFTIEPSGETPEIDECQRSTEIDPKITTAANVQKKLVGLNPNKSPGLDNIHPKS